MRRKLKIGNAIASATPEMSASTRRIGERNLGTPISRLASCALPPSPIGRLAFPGRANPARCFGFRWDGRLFGPDMRG